MPGVHRSVHADVFSMPVFHVPGGHLLWHTVLDNWALPAVEYCPALHNLHGAPVDGSS